jgi:hypothetical protein
MNNQQQNWATPPTTNPPRRLSTESGQNPRSFNRNDSSVSNISYGAARPTPQRAKSSQGGNEGIIVANRAGDEETEDGRIRNREAATKIRDAWIYKQIRARQVCLVLAICFLLCFSIPPLFLTN